MRDQRLLSKLQASLDAIKQSWCEVHVVPFSAELPALPSRALEEGVICYGASFVPRVASNPLWNPGIFFDDSLFRWSVLQKNWGDNMFSLDGACMTLETAIGVLERTRSERFVRPDRDSKSFDGGLYDVRGLRHVSATCDKNEMVMVATPVTVDAEWRCFVVNNQVVAASEYRRAGSPSLFCGAPSAAVDLVETVAQKWMPAPVACIDVASDGQRLGVIEANCFSASRFYEADIPAVLAAVSRFSLADGT